MKKSEIIKGVTKLYMNQFLAMATPGSGSWNLYQIPTGYALLKSKEGNMFYGESNILIRNVETYSTSRFVEEFKTTLKG